MKNFSNDLIRLTEHLALLFMLRAQDYRGDYSNSVPITMHIKKCRLYLPEKDGLQFFALIWIALTCNGLFWSYDVRGKCALCKSSSACFRTFLEQLVTARDLMSTG